MLLVASVRRALPLVVPLRVATASMSVICSVVALADAAYRPIGIDTPVPEVSIFAVALVYSLGPALAGAALIFVAALAEFFHSLAKK